MATVQQAIKIHNNLSRVDSRFVGISTIVIKGIRTARKLGKKGGSSKRSLSIGSRKESSTESKALETLERMEGILKNIDSNVKKIEESVRKPEKKLAQLTGIPTDNWTGKTGAGLALAASTFGVAGGLLAILNKMKSHQETKESPTPTTSEKDKQAKLEERLNALTSGIAEWKSKKTAPTVEEKQAKLEGRLNALMAGVEVWKSKRTVPTAEEKQGRLEERLNALTAGIKEWRTTREVPTPEDKQGKLEERLNALTTGIEKWRTNRTVLTSEDKQSKLDERLNVLTAGIEEWRTNRTVPTPEEKQAKLEERLNALLAGVKVWRATLSNSNSINERMKTFSQTFKDTLNELAKYLKIVFEEPLKIVSKQFLVAGYVSIMALKGIETGIKNVTRALNSLQSTVAIMKENSVVAQQSIGSSTVSSEKAAEITRSAGSQSVNRQTIINMNSNMPVNASIHNGMDMDTFLRQLSAGMDMAMRSSAEGVHL